MAAKTFCASLLLASGSLAQLGDIQREIPSGLSPECLAAAEALEDVQSWRNAEFQFMQMNDFMCNRVAVPEFDGNRKVERCIFGAEFLAAEADDLWITIAEHSVLQVITRASDNVQQVNLVRFFDGIPRECNTDDYQIYEEFIESYFRDQVEAEYPSPDYTSTVQNTIFVNDGGYPANYGPGFEGYQTYINVLGIFPMDTTLLEIACDDCSPQWSVEIPIPGFFGSVPGIATYIAAFLNADENFQSESIAIYAELAGNADKYGASFPNLNIFSQDDAEITISVDGGAATPISDTVVTANGATLEFKGDRDTFSTSLSTGVGRPDSGSSASAIAPVFGIATLTFVSSLTLLA